MNDLGTSAVSHAAYVMLVLQSVAMVIAFVRLARGPSIPDRVVALDVIGALVVGMIALYSIASSNPEYLRVAMTVALITFLGTIGFAYYLQRRILK